MMASSKLAVFTIVFGVAYAVICVICTEMNLPLLTYHPLIGEVDFLWTPERRRDYGIAARMLHMLGCTRVLLLLTNKPAKLNGLARTGIEVSGRIALHVAVNADSRRYLTAKATRAGHALDPLFAAVAKGAPVGGDGRP